MNKQQALEVLVRVGNVWAGFELTDGRIAEWVDVLVDSDFDEVQARITRLRGTNKFPPSLAELSTDDGKFYDDDGEEISEMAWAAQEQGKFMRTETARKWSGQ